MTELLQQVIAQIEKLPLDRQDAISNWLLGQLQDEQNSCVVDTSNCWNEQDRADITDFSFHCADTNLK